MGKRIEVTVDGVKYSSITAFCNSVGIPRTAIAQRMLRGMSIKKALNTKLQNNGIVYKYQGKTYHSTPKLAKAFNITPTVLRRRLDLGWTLDKALSYKIAKTRIVIKIEGKSFYSLRDVARYYKVKHQTLSYRIKRGWTLPAALEIGKHKRIAKCNGTIYVITNTINNKKYIGLTNQRLAVRLKGHIRNAIKYNVKNKLAKAIRKLGPAAFSIEAIDHATTFKKLAALEKYYIDKYNTINNGYNSIAGGGTGNFGNQKLVNKPRIKKSKSGKA